MGSRRQSASVGLIMVTWKYTTKSEELRSPYVTAITWEDESGSDLGEILCDDGQ